MPTSTRPPSPPPGHDPLRRSVLLAEDDGELRATLREMLREQGFEVHEFADGQALLDELIARRDRLGVPPDLVVTDVRMPGPGGLDVLGRLRQFDRLTPVLIITAYADDATHRAAAHLGARLLPKPFDLEELRRALDATG